MHCKLTKTSSGLNVVSATDKMEPIEILHMISKIRFKQSAKALADQQRIRGQEDDSPAIVKLQVQHIPRARTRFTTS